MLKLLVIILLSVSLAGSRHTGNVYSAWTEDGLHLMISDNGTPEDMEDDFICDWETNRGFTITIYD